MFFKRKIVFLLSLLAGSPGFSADEDGIRFDFNPRSEETLNRCIEIKNHSDFGVRITLGERNSSFLPFSSSFAGETRELDLFPSNTMPAGSYFQSKAIVNAPSSNLLLKSEIVYRPKNLEKPSFRAFVTEETLAFRVAGYGAQVVLTPVFGKYLLGNVPELNDVMTQLSEELLDVIEKIDPHDQEGFIYLAMQSTIKKFSQTADFLGVPVQYTKWLKAAIDSPNLRQRLKEVGLAPILDFYSQASKIVATPYR